MKFPEDIKLLLYRRYQTNHQKWLIEFRDGNCDDKWPLQIPLGSPGEKELHLEYEKLRSWVAAWHQWQQSGNSKVNNNGSLVWTERKFKTHGIQKLPAKLCLSNPTEIATWIGEEKRWSQAKSRYQRLISHWPQLTSTLPRFFKILADYSESDFQRLFGVISWLIENPNSNLYPRQLPIVGIDSKWLENRQNVVLESLLAIRQLSRNDKPNFYEICGLKKPPATLLRMKILRSEFIQIFRRCL